MHRSWSTPPWPKCLRQGVPQQRRRSLNGEREGSDLKRAAAEEALEGAMGVVLLPPGIEDDRHGMGFAACVADTAFQIAVRNEEARVDERLQRGFVETTDPDGGDALVAGNQQGRKQC